MDAGPPTTAGGLGTRELLEGTQSRVHPGTYMAQRHHGAHCNYQEFIADTISHRSILVGFLLLISLRILSRTVSKSDGIQGHGNGVARLEMVEASIFSVVRVLPSCVRVRANGILIDGGEFGGVRSKQDKRRFFVNMTTVLLLMGLARKRNHILDIMHFRPV
jgi:hypothetical protein